MKHILFLTLFISLVFTASGGDRRVPPPHSFFVGKYILFGIHPKNQKPYKGMYTLKVKDGKLLMIREVDGKKTEAICEFEPKGMENLGAMEITYTLDDTTYQIIYHYYSSSTNCPDLVGHSIMQNELKSFTGYECLIFRE